MRTRHPVHDLGFDESDSQWHPRSDALRHADNVRLHAGVLDRPPFSSATCSTLNFVSDQQNSMAVANPPQLLPEDCGCGAASALALSRLNEISIAFLRPNKRVD